MGRNVTSMEDMDVNLQALLSANVTQLTALWMGSMNIQEPLFRKHLCWSLHAAADTPLSIEQVKGLLQAVSIARRHQQNPTHKRYLMTVLVLSDVLLPCGDFLQGLSMRRRSRIVCRSKHMLACHTSSR